MALVTMSPLSRALPSLGDTLPPLPDETPPAEKPHWVEQMSMEAGVEEKP